ncbi:MAG: DUF2971 domain-containing protein [Armatimonadota bacterium]
MLETGLSNPTDFCFGSWFAGSCLTQNDRDEFGIAGGAFLNYVADHENKDYQRIGKLVHEELDNFGAFFLNTVSETYAVCFSTKPDDLQQWLIYGDLGQGVCLEIDAELLWEVSEQQKWNFTDVLYGEEEICERLETYLEECGQSLSGQHHVANEEKFEPLLPLAAYIAFFSLVGAKSKSQAFKSECEWRLFSQSWGPTLDKFLKNNRRRVINRNGYLRHGVVVDLHASRSLVTKIILGPKCTNPSTMQTIGTLLTGFPKCMGTELVQSDVPFAG